MQELLISQLSITGTSTPTAIDGQKVFEFTINFPILHFIAVAIVFFAAFLVFNLFFKTIWAD